MPIEFRCTGCNQLLRVPESAVGQQAKCPNCSAVQTIPATSQSGPSAEAAAAPPPPPPMFHGDSPNPFVAPRQVGDYSSEPLSSLERNGPPWERDGKSFASYWATLKLVLTDPAKMFSTMNRTDGVGPPLMFALCEMVGACIILMVFIFGFAALMTIAKGAPADLAMRLGGPACLLVFFPLLGIVGLFVLAGILHLSLMIVGGAKQPFDTTFRVVAYVSGCTSWIGLIPYIGGLIAFVALVVYSIIGFIHAHEITGGKSTLAVLLPALLCCGLSALAFASLMVIGIAAQN